MSERRVLVENVSNATVVFTVENYNFIREFVGEGAKSFVAYDMLIEGLGNPGNRILFDEGFLYISDKQDRIDLGLEESDTTKVSVISSKEMLEILNRGNNTEIKTTLDNLAPEQQKKFAGIAINNKISSAGARQLILNATGIDVLDRIRQNEKAAEDAKAPDID